MQTFLSSFLLLGVFAFFFCEGAYGQGPKTQSLTDFILLQQEEVAQEDNPPPDAYQKTVAPPGTSSADSSTGTLPSLGAYPQATPGPTPTPTPRPTPSTRDPLILLRSQAQSTPQPKQSPPILQPPTKDTPPRPTPPPKRPSPAKRQLDPNYATLEQLAALPGMDANRAGLIVSHRQSIGRFKSVSDLLDVFGVSEPVYEKIKPHLKVAPPPEPALPDVPTP